MRSYRKISAFILLLTIGITDSLLDSFISLDDTAMGVLYICCILLVSRESKKTILVTCAMAIVFIVMDFLVMLHTNSNPSLGVYLNLSISMLAVSIATYLVLRHNKTENEAIRAKEEYIQSLEEMLFMTSHKLRSPICTLQGIMDITKEDREEHQFEYHNEIEHCVLKMDEFTRELTKFIEEKGRNHTKTQDSSPKKILQYSRYHAHPVIHA